MVEKVMGVHPKISAETFPEQGRDNGLRVEVCFHYDLTQIIQGTVVRDDAEDPHRTIIKLDDGRYVLATECQYSIPLLKDIALLKNGTAEEKKNG